MDAAAATGMGLHAVRQGGIRTSAGGAAGDDFRESPARGREVQPVHGERHALSARPGVRVEAGRALPADISQPDGRFASAAPASASVRNRGDLRKGNGGHHQGYGGGSLVWAGERGFHSRSTGADAVSLPYPAPHGLRVQGAVEIRLRSYMIGMQSRVQPDYEASLCRAESRDAYDVSAARANCFRFARVIN